MADDFAELVLAAFCAFEGEGAPVMAEPDELDDGVAEADEALD